ncbi:AMP-binding protein, partial [Photobacterium sp. DNB22_13_2]
LNEQAVTVDTRHIQVLAGGESGPQALYRELQVLFGDVWQVYGPTETCIWSTAAQMTGQPSTDIGYPLADEQCYVLDGQGRAVPFGAPGELYISGAGLARGYFNQPELTAERFVEQRLPLPDKGSSVVRLYRTGDRVRRRADGSLTYLGRRDGQVKIRGYRIELGEVEHALLGLPQIKLAAVIDRQRNGQSYLAAYVTLPEGEESADWATAGAWRTELAARLPEYMVPATLTVLPSLPVNSSGKLDRRALPEPEWVNAAQYVAPRNAQEQQLCTLWQ